MCSWRPAAAAKFVATLTACSISTQRAEGEQKAGGYSTELHLYSDTVHNRWSLIVP
jgi:hypothetical protein